MTRIYIDTAEVRDLARFLRQRSGDLAPIKQSANRATDRTYVAPPWAFGIHWERGLANAGIDLLGTRLWTDSVGLDGYAGWVEFREYAGGPARRWIPRIRGWTRIYLILLAPFFPPALLIDPAVRKDVLDFLNVFIDWAVAIGSIGVIDPFHVKPTEGSKFERWNPNDRTDSPASLLQLMTRLNSDRQSGEVLVIRVNPGEEPPRFIVMLPGIQSLGGNDSRQDFPDAFKGMNTGRSAYSEAVKEAMRQAGVPTNGTAEVLLVGHSQGGIAAMNLAADESFRSTYNLKGVMTAGSPVTSNLSYSRVPPSVQALSIENVNDVVPQLDEIQGGLTTIIQGGLTTIGAVGSIGANASVPAGRVATFNGPTGLSPAHQPSAYADAAARIDIPSSFTDMVKGFSTAGKQPVVTSYRCLD